MKKFKWPLFLFFLLTTMDSFSQNIQMEINDQVWRVQLEGMNNNQVEKFMSVMSDDVIQVSYARKSIRNKIEFHNQAASTYNRFAERKLTRKMEFRFLNRFGKDTNAFEDGFFKYELTNEKNESQVFYGYFQVVLRKESDSWKVLVDYDSDTYHGEPVTEDLFENATPMNNYEN